MNQPFTSFADFKRRYPIRPNDAGALLGSGSYGRVFKVEDQLETEWVAIKISEFKGNDAKSLKAEVELAQRVPRQANIARYDACYRLETDTSVSDFAIMKYYPDGNLADLLHHTTLTPAQIYDITQGILLGLQHLHRNRIVHRDFKPANILISRDNAGRFIPKIADFGLSKLVSSDELDNSDFDLSDGRGTPSYKAPEQIEGSRVSFNLDLWAFGVILYEMLTGEKPFRVDQHNSSEQSVRREIEKQIVQVILPARLNQVAEPYATMIRRCLVRDIHERVRREDELLDLLDAIPQLLADAQTFVSQHRYEQARPLFEQILNKREHHADAQAGLDLCRSTLGNQQLNQWLSKADEYVGKQQFEQAKNTYEQVLQLDPTHLAAVRGLALCVSRLRPDAMMPPEPTLEQTDVFQESTDVYPTPAEPVAVGHQSVLAGDKPVTGEKAMSAKLLDRPPVSLPVQAPIRRPVPWRTLAPVAAVLIGLSFYYNVRSGPTTTQTPSMAEKTTTDVSKAGLVDMRDATPADQPRAIVSPKAMLSERGSTVVAAANSISQRIDVALDKARSAYERKDYAFAVEMCSSALQLDPARQDVAAFLNSSIQAKQRQAADIAQAESTKSAATMQEEKEKELKESKERELREKQEAQVAYDQLVEDGMKAIASSNNKAVAIVNFGKASALASQHTLNTARGDGAYTTYLIKANKIFDNDEYEGAKGWYKVAQALKDTPEVRTKIKQCILQ